MKTPRIHNHSDKPKESGGSGRGIHYGPTVSPISTARELGLGRPSAEGGIAIPIEISENDPITDQNDDSSHPWRRWLNRYTVVITVLVIGAIAIVVLAADHPTCCAPNPYSKYINHDAYYVIDSSWLDEYDASLTLYKHRATRAEFLAFVPNVTKSLSSDKGGYDPKPDKVFGISFRTKTESSNGVPHILEHSVLDGSRKYPSRSPFKQMQKGSLYTFLNAMTYPDRTVYPVASRNTADFRNLMDVYLDAVFHPLAIEEEGWWILRQEGWRYDIVGTNNTEQQSNYTKDIDRAELEYKGVVYSEMKGAYSDPDDLRNHLTDTVLFPDSPYRFDSGGDPAVIPTLTQEEFEAYYRHYYHPTNARLFVAGEESDVYHALNAADEYMSPMGYNPKSREDSMIEYQQKNFQEPLHERRPFAVSATEDGGPSEGHMLIVTWLLNNQSMTGKMELAWIVLDDLLLGRPSSPLRKALEDSNLGEKTIGGGLDDGLLQSTFAIGMKGVQSRDDVIALEKLIMDTFQTLASEGFSRAEIDGSMNTLEFQLREGGAGLRGLEVFLASIKKWNYDLDPKDALVYEDDLKLMKKDIAKRGSKVFQQMIHHSILENNHCVVLELFPSTTLAAEQAQDEKERISREQSLMSDDEHQRLMNESLKLKELHETEETPEVIATIPSLSISDIDPLPIEYPIHVEEEKTGIRVISHEVASSGIAYIDIGLDISMIPYEDIILLPSFTALLNRAGTSDMSDVEFRNHIDTVTGGVSASLKIMSVKPSGWDNETRVLPGVNMLTMLFIRGKCTQDKISDLFSILQKVITDINFDDSQVILRNALKSSLSSKKSSIASKGHSYANRRIRGRYSVRSFIDEKMYGVSSLDSIAKVLEAVESDWGQFVIRLKKLREAILNGSQKGVVLNLTGDRSVLAEVLPKAKEFLANGFSLDLNSVYATPEFRSTDHPWVSSAREDMLKSNPVQDEGIAVSTQVSYAGAGGRLYNEGDSVKGSVSVASNYLSKGYMYDVLRAKYGSYGAGLKFSSIDGIARFYTYRDPNPPEVSLDAFHAAADSLLKDASSSTLTQNKNAAITTAVIGTIGDLDGSALSARSAGWVSLNRYLYGESAQCRERWRKEVLQASLDDFVDFAQRLKSWRTPSVAIVASQSTLDEMDRNLTVIKVQ